MQAQFLVDDDKAGAHVSFNEHDTATKGSTLTSAQTNLSGLKDDVTDLNKEVTETTKVLDSDFCKKTADNKDYCDTYAALKKLQEK